MEISLNSTIYKYTNFLYGYQERYFKIRNGAIYYYLHESEKGGCRRFRILKNFGLELDKRDPCKFDLIFADGETWNLLFRTRTERDLWSNALQGLSSEGAQLNGNASASSSSSRTSYATEPASPGGGGEPHHGEKEAEEFSDLLHNIASNWKEINEILYLAAGADHLPTENDAKLGKALKRIKQMERDLHSVKLELRARREQLRANNQATPPANAKSSTTMPGEEEEVWEDAVDTTVTQQIHQDSSDVVLPNSTSQDDKCAHPVVNGAAVEKQPAVLHACTHPLMPKVQAVVKEQLNFAFASPESGLWELFVKEGELRMYKMEGEVNGVAVDPLKAVHTVEGVSAREFIDCFFDPSLKTEWDDTIVGMNVVERITDDFVIVQQLHRRIWPTSQRESLFWSTKANVSEHRETGYHDAWMVCNSSHSLEESGIPLMTSGAVRVKVTVCMLCQTQVLGQEAQHESGKDAEKPIPQSRSDVRCRIYYVAEIHPGGWVPTAGLRQVYKKEFPKFLRGFSKYVTDRQKHKPLII